MLKSALAIAFLALLTARASTEPQRIVRMQVKWLSHEEKGCKGCKTETVILYADSSFEVATEYRDGVFGIKLIPHFEGDGIQVRIIEQKNALKPEKSDGDSAVVLVHGKEQKQVTVAGFRFGISAEEYVEKPGGEENKPNHSTAPPATPAAGQEARQP